MNNAWMDLPAASAYSGISVFTLRKLCRQKKIKRGRDGKAWRLKAEFIDAYLLINAGEQ